MLLCSDPWPPKISGNENYILPTIQHSADRAQIAAQDYLSGESYCIIKALMLY